MLKRCAFFIFLSLILIASGCARQHPNMLHVTMSLGEEEWSVLRTKVFPLFEESHSVKIQSYQVNAEHLLTKLEALDKTGRAKIDVFAQDNMNLAGLVQKGLIADLSAYREKIPGNVLTNLITAGEFDGRLFFMPFRPNVQIIYYNDAAFKKYNLSPPQDWEQLKNVAKVFYEKEGRGRILFKGYGGNPTATQVYELILQAGGDPYAFDDAGCIAAFEFLRSLRPYLSPETKRAKWDTTNDVLAKQEAYLASNWPFGVVILVKNYKLDFIKTYHGYRGPAGEAHVIGGDVFGIPKNSSQKDLALQFIAFMQSKTVQEILTSELGWPSIRDDAYGNVPEWQREHYDSVARALKKGVFRKNVTWWPAYKKYVNLAFQDIVFKGRDVRTVLREYKAQLEKEKLSLR